MLERDERTSLFCRKVSDKEKKFITITTRRTFACPRTTPGKNIINNLTHIGQCQSIISQVVLKQYFLIRRSIFKKYGNIVHIPSSIVMSIISPTHTLRHIPSLRPFSYYSNQLKCQKHSTRIIRYISSKALRQLTIAFSKLMCIDQCYSVMSSLI